MIMLKNNVNIKFNSNDEFSLNKMIEISGMIIVVRAISHEDNKYYAHVF